MTNPFEGVYEGHFWIFAVMIYRQPLCSKPLHCTAPKHLFSITCLYIISNIHIRHSNVHVRSKPVMHPHTTHWCYLHDDTVCRNYSEILLWEWHFWWGMVMNFAVQMSFFQGNVLSQGHLRPKPGLLWMAYLFRLQKLWTTVPSVLILNFVIVSSPSKMLISPLQSSTIKVRTVFVPFHVVAGELCGFKRLVCGDFSKIIHLSETLKTYAYNC